MDVSVWLCPTRERKDELAADAHRQYRGLFPGIIGLRPRTRSGAGQTYCSGDGSSWLAQEQRLGGSRRTSFAFLAFPRARIAACRTLMAPLERTAGQSRVLFS